MTKLDLRAIRCLVAAMIVFLTSNLGHAQVLYGSLTGTVTDPTGLAIPGVKVQALNVETGVPTEGVTDERGTYSFTTLQPGNYKITVTAPSFRTVIQDNVRITANEVRRADFALQTPRPPSRSKCRHPP
jgi:hypothetical protein